MKANYNKRISELLSEIRAIATQNLPKGQALQISNRLDKLRVVMRKADIADGSVGTRALRDPDAPKYIATVAIKEALLNGRSVSQLDAREFQVTDVRSIISILKRGGHLPGLQSKWIPTPNSWVKEYWLEFNNNAS